MRVTLDSGCASFDLAFEFVDAAAKLMVELAHPKQLIVLSCERALNALQFLAQQRDQRLRFTDELCASIFELVFEAMYQRNDCLAALIIESLDSGVAVHRTISVSS